MRCEPAAGLTEAEAARRHAAGLGNVAARRSTRSLGEIVRANVFTRFNAILGALLVVILVVGPIQDALFGIVLVTNAAIGIVQELRAKRTLDRLAVLVTPTATVVRDGHARTVAVEDVAAGDLLEASPGDQIVVDGTLVTGEGFEVDSSLVSGEAEPVPKAPGDEVLSGSFVTAGRATYVAERVGSRSYARTLADEARRFTLVRSDLRQGIDQILRWVTWLIAPTAVVLVSSQVVANEDLAEAVRGSVAGVGAMVPEGLVLLTSLAFAVSVVRLGRQRVVVQELAAVEGLARVDVVCVDKTGTLTDAELRVAAVEPLSSIVAAPGLAAMVAADQRPNASLRAIAAWLTQAEPVVDLAGHPIVPFSSGRRWSAAAQPDGTTWVLGAPDVLLSASTTTAALGADISTAVTRHTSRGRRVLLLARASEAVREASPLPPVEAAALIALEERVRPDAASTVEYFLGQGVTLKVLSGDDPRTVAAIATQVGIPDAESALDARDLPLEPAELAAIVDAHAVYGRVDPHRKRAIIEALRAEGHVVAMTGDGVNDVLALKEADLGVAMGSGSAAARGVAQCVLLDSTWASLPGVLAEGRRVIGNVERVANLFVTKTVYAFLLAVAVGVARLPFPFLPRQLTVVSSLTIGIPAFFLALASNAERAQPHFTRRVLRFAAPAGFVAAAATFAGYALAREEPGVSLTAARTTATILLFAVATWVLSILARPLVGWRAALLAAMVAGFVCIAVTPGTRELFGLELPPAVVLLAAIGVASIANLVLEGGWRLTGWVSRHPRRLTTVRAWLRRTGR
jgi:cation-transporting ATPase E